MAQPFTEPCDSGVIAAEPCPFEQGGAAGAATVAVMVDHKPAD